MSIVARRFSGSFTPSPVATAGWDCPRQVPPRQTEGLAEAGMGAYCGTELEFIVFRDTYEQAWSAGYRNLTPANQYNVDYSVLGTARIEPLLRRIRNEMTGAGFVVESAKDRKSTRLNSSHANISYAVFCLKKKDCVMEPRAGALLSNPTQQQIFEAVSVYNSIITGQLRYTLDECRMFEMSHHMNSAYKCFL